MSPSRRGKPLLAAPRSSLYHARVSRVEIVTPDKDAAGSGNATTATRWARRLRELGHRVHVSTRYDGRVCDVMLALHARKSAAAIRRYRKLFPRRPLIVALTGTDVYRDLARSESARLALEMATRIVVLQKLALRELAPRLRRRAVVIEQSEVAPSARERAARRKVTATTTAAGATASATAASGVTTAATASARSTSAPKGRFEIAVLANLRHVKDPLRTALAARRLPKTSRIHVSHAGSALSAAYERRAARESRANPRYTWLGPLSRRRARALLLRSQALVLSSRLEGGANVVSEAIVCGVPVLTSRIPGSVGLLGQRYPGYFEVGDTAGLTYLLERFENERRFARRLRQQVRTLAPRFTPARERSAWKKLLAGLSLGFALFASSASAQVNIETLRQRDADRTIATTIDVRLEHRTGNVEHSKLDIDVRSDLHTQQTHSFALVRGGLGLLGGDRFTNEGLAHLRFMYGTRKWVPEVFVQGDYDKARKLDARVLGGTGLRLELYASTTRVVAWGSSWMLEYESYDLDETATHATSTTVQRWSNYIVVRRNLGSAVALSWIAYAQPRFDAFSDLRVLVDASLGVGITARLAMTTTFHLRYDSKPPDDIEDLDTSLATGLQIAF